MPMHPILESRRRVLWYLLAWTPILALLVYVTSAYGRGLLETGGGARWRRPALVYAFVCLSP